MKLTNLLHLGKHRRHPIKLDQEGKSLRKRCFEAFDQGGRPVAVAATLKMKPATALRYFESWKRLGPQFENRYRFVRKALKNDSGLREDILTQLSKNLEISRDEVLRRLLPPWGLRQMISHKFPIFFSPEEESEGEYRLRLGLTFADFFKGWDESYADFYADLEQFLRNHIPPAPEGKEAEAKNSHKSKTKPQERQQGPARARFDFDLQKLTPEKLSELESYVAQKSAEEDARDFIALIDLMTVIGISREQATEALFQSALKVHGEEKTKELWSRLSNNLDTYLKTHHQGPDSPGTM